MPRTMRRTPYTYKKDLWKELPPFDPAQDYTAKELELYANAMLSDTKGDEGPRILFQENIEQRDWRREVYANSGTVDDEITKAISRDGQMMYNRQHPQGRRVNSEQQRKVNGASYYR
jgi:hypothetical protein